MRVIVKMKMRMKMEMGRTAKSDSSFTNWTNSVKDTFEPDFFRVS